MKKIDWEIEFDKKFVGFIFPDTEEGRFEAKLVKSFIRRTLSSQLSDLEGEIEGMRIYKPYYQNPALSEGFNQALDDILDLLDKKGGGGK